MKAHDAKLVQEPTQEMLERIKHSRKLKAKAKARKKRRDDARKAKEELTQNPFGVLRGE